MRAIGLMSGTSMDGIDVALIETDGETVTAFGPVGGYPYSQQERQLLREAMESARGLVRRDDRSGVLGVAEALITSKHTDAIKAFASANAIDLAGVDVVGFHGQTVVHRPERGLTVQLGDGKALGHALGTQVVYDFRAADMAAGGHGAPLVPVYHRALALLANMAQPVVFVNIGGIANITFIPEGGEEAALIAFDAGPGNCLLDDWVLQRTGLLLDNDGRLAMSGTVDVSRLRALLAHPHFTLPAPKSLDRGTFEIGSLAGLGTEDGAATLTAFTVAGIAAGVRLLPGTAKTWVVTGGGSRNPHMVEGLRRVLDTIVVTANEAGFNADFMEAQAFAYLAVRYLRGLPSSFPGTTGVTVPVVAGVGARHL